MRRWKQSCQAAQESESRARLGGPEGAGGPRPDGTLVVEFFRDGHGAPFERWYATLPPQAQTWADSKILRLAKSLDLLYKGTKLLRSGLREVRHLGAGPGYRVYLTVTGNRLIILGGGNKSTQAKDVEDARRRLRSLQHREGGHAPADHRTNGQQS